MVSPGSLTKILPPSGVKAIHIGIVLMCAVLAGFWVLSWIQGGPDSYANQNVRGFTLVLTLLLVSLATLGRGRMLRLALLAIAGGFLLANFLLI